MLLQRQGLHMYQRSNNQKIVVRELFRYRSFSQYFGKDRQDTHSQDQPGDYLYDG